MHALGPSIRVFLRQPLSRAVLLSICLHLAVLALVQIQPVVERGEAPLFEVRIAQTAEKKVEASRSSSQPAQHTQPVEAEKVLAQRLEVAANRAEVNKAEVQKAQAAPLALNLPAVFDSHWYGAREVDRHPKAVGRIQPSYPENARQDGLEGWVKLRLKIDEQGRVSEIEVVEAQPQGVFDAAAAGAFKQARFEPAIKQGVPVRYEGFFRVVFELE